MAGVGGRWRALAGVGVGKVCLGLPCVKQSVAGDQQMQHITGDSPQFRPMLPSLFH